MEEKWTTVIKAKTGWFDINLKELIQYKDLVGLFVKRNYAVRYKQTILGPMWLILNPLITTLLYSFIFGNVAGLSTDGAPQLLFYMISNAVWTYFANCINQTSSTFTSNASLFGKVYFPRLISPISVVLTSLLDLLIQIGMFVIAMLIYVTMGYRIQINVWILAIPLLVLQMALLGLGFGIIVSSLTTKYRDLSILVTFGVQLWMYASPVVYSLSQIPEKLQSIYLLNPIAPVIIIFRHAVLGIGEVPIMMWGVSWLITLFVLFLGVILFSRIEKTFMDTV